ncbi:MAG: M50 family metallopeptidase [bacterium]|nr:M50 family metallopeptidase [bacterium]
MDFIIILLVLVVLHEFGHFIAAKRSGVRVEEFGFGLPPRVFGRKFGKKPEPGKEDERTLFSFNLLPIGGFVRLTGEDAIYSDESDPRNFQNAPLWKRMIIVLSGVVMNFALGIALFAIVYSYIGIPVRPPQIDVLVGQVVADSPASQAGLKEGDRIEAFNGQKVKDSETLIADVKKRADTVVNLTIVRDSQSQEVSLTPRGNPPPGQGALGVQLDQKLRTTFYPSWQMPFHGIAAGAYDTFEMSKQILPALSNLVGSIIVKQEVPSDVAGPVGIYRASQLFCGNSMLSCLQFAGLLSVNLAIFNLLPIPALDGGRFAFMLYEAITRRKPNAKFEQWSHAIFFALLILLLIFVTYNDIFVSKGFLK